MNNKIGLVTMCRKAGKLVMGMDCLLYTSDAADE